MNDDVSILVEMYKLQVARSEHYENLRASAANVVLALSAALVALATIDQRISRADTPVGLALLVLGCYGYVMSRSWAPFKPTWKARGGVS